jgi:type VI secretion system protein ImpG
VPIVPRFDLRALANDARQFARALPTLGASLVRPVADPATERLVEGVYFLAGTILDKLGDFQAQAHDDLAERICPWLRRPVPSATVIAFEPPPAGCAVVPAATPLKSVPIDRVPCMFRTVGECQTFAYRAEDASIDSPPGRAQSVRVALTSTSGEALNRVLNQGVTFYVDGEIENALRVVHALSSDAQSVEVSSPDWPRPLTVDPLLVKRAGLTRDLALAPDPDGMTPAFGVVTDSFVFPHAFRFIHVAGLGACSSAPPTKRVTFTFVLREALAAGTWLAGDEVRTNCAIAVNLFETCAEPVPLLFERGPVVIRPAGIPRHAAAVFAVLDARVIARNGEAEPIVLPNSRRLAAARSDDRCSAVFSTSLDATGGGDPEVTVSFGSRAGASAEPVESVVSMRILATNGFLAERLRVGDLAGHVQVSGVPIAYRNIVAASGYFPPPTGDAFALRVVRHAAIRRGTDDALSALKDMLFLSIPSSVAGEGVLRGAVQRIEALRSLKVGAARREISRRAIRLGYAYRLSVDEAAFRGPGELGLFGASLWEALGRSLPVNTFVDLTIVGTRGTFKATFPRKAGA